MKKFWQKKGVSLVKRKKLSLNFIARVKIDSNQGAKPVATRKKDAKEIKRIKNALVTESMA